MDTPLKYALTASLALHLMLFGATSFHPHGRTITVSFPVELVAPKSGAGEAQEEPTAEKKGPPEEKAEDRKKTPEPVSPPKKKLVSNKVTVKKKAKDRKAAAEAKKDADKKTIETGGTGQKFFSGSGLMSSVSLDNSQFPYTVYLKNIQRTIDSNWDYSKATTARAVVYFRILPDGTITGVKVEKSSGNKIFDLLAKRAAELSEMPPLPADYKEDYLAVHFEFIYRE